MKNLEKFELVDLSKEETLKCEGGSAALALAAFGASCLALYYIGYAVGRLTR